MATIDLKKAFGKMNSVALGAVSGAVELRGLRGEERVELAHVLTQMSNLPDSDFKRICTVFGVDTQTLAADLARALQQAKRGGAPDDRPVFHPVVLQAIQQSWLYATMLLGEFSVRTGHMIVALTSEEELRPSLVYVSSEFEKIDATKLRREFAKLTAGSPEDGAMAADGSSSQLKPGAPGQAGQPAQPGAPDGQSALAKFAVDLTARAKEGKIDPVTGRDGEIRQIVDILMRRRQNNPILTGEAGVGKTALVEGFALRVVAGDVPPALKNVSVRALDLGLLQAGASVKGEFENRLRQVIDEVQASAQPIILFIDEAHTLIGAGGSAGQNDAANLLKPALARGTLRTIAATTWAEYKKYFEKDPALTRRFQTVKVDEPDDAKAIAMMRGVRPILEKHHGVRLLDDAIAAAVQMSRRYIPARQLPDKAMSLLDTACARVAVSQHATPGAIEDLVRAKEAMTVELNAIKREAKLGVDHAKRIGELEAKLKSDEDKITELTKSWNAEKELVGEIVGLQRKIDESKDASSPADTAKLRETQEKLAKMQGERPLVLPMVDHQAVSSVISDWTGIPVGRMVSNEISGVLNLASTIEKRVIGQRHALDAIASGIQVSRARLANAGKPVGVFMLVGPSGVGKTETAHALADAIYGGPHALITINMSEFQEPHKVATLMGSPPGYVGYGQGGVLTEAVRRRPYSVVLLDEVEKAHADVHEIFFQVFDKGQMKDSEGIDIDFRNTVILLTSNVASDLVMSMTKDPDTAPSPQAIADAMRPALLKVFPAALLGRLHVIPYYPINDNMLRSIIKLQLTRVGQRAADAHKASFSYDDSVVELIASRCTEVESGARAVDAIITRGMLPEISKKILDQLLENRPITRVHVGAKDGAFVYDLG